MLSTITSIVAIGVGELHLALAVKRFLADLHSQHRFGGDLPRQARARARRAFPAGDDAIDQADAIGVLRAEIMSPVSSISIARLRDTLRDSATIGVEQNSPILTPGVANRAVSDATARSQLATSWQPAAAATPSTAAITGWGILRIDMHHRAALLHQAAEIGAARDPDRCDAPSFPSCRDRR